MSHVLKDIPVGLLQSATVRDHSLSNYISKDCNVVRQEPCKVITPLCSRSLYGSTLVIEAGCFEKRVESYY